jgi:hypothetical protein
MPKVFLVLLLSVCAFGQTGTTGMGGTGGVGGVTGMSTPTPIPPPPPLGILARMFGGIYNSSSPSWPPKDSTGAAMQQGTCRIWDSGAKIGQLMTVTGAIGSETFAFNWAPLDNIIKRCAQVGGFTGAPNAPMKVIYTLGDTPCGAALGPYNEPATGAITNCPQPPPPAAQNTGGCLAPDFAWSCAAYRDNVTGSAAESDKTFMTFIQNLISHLASLGIVPDAIELQNEFDISSGGFQCWNQTSACGSPATNPHNTVNATMLKAMVQRGWDLRQILSCKSPTTQIYWPSDHQGTILPGEISDNFINTSTTVHALTAGANGYPGGCPNVPSQTVFGWQVTDVVNMHPDGSPNTPEALVTSNKNLECERSANGTAGCSGTHSGSAWTHLVGLPKSWNEFGSKAGDCSTVDCLAGVTARRYILCAMFQYQDCDYYQMDAKNPTGSFISLITPPAGPPNIAGTAFDQVALWMIGGSPSGYLSPMGTIYEESFTNSSGVNQVLVWDSSATDANGGYTCSNVVGGAGCTTVVVPSSYIKFESLDGVVHSVNGSHQIAVGGKVVCVTTNPSGC